MQLKLKVDITILARDGSDTEFNRGAIFNVVRDSGLMTVIQPKDSTQTYIVTQLDREQFFEIPPRRIGPDQIKER